MNGFTYGVLMFPDVFQGILGSQAPKGQEAVLKGYERRCVKDKVYPGIIPSSQDKSVKGVLYLGLTEQQVKILDDYEGKQYTNINVSVSDSLGQQHEAFAYLHNFPQNLLQDEWQPQQFQQKHKQAYKKQRLGPKKP